ncbi:calcium/sodium antiporter [Aliidiomarina halalkaliphila]|uniref:Calcium/sodium antiporter n=1 Tax=Aliidiomarina halalkaliphila TaxID=2593535 RepID=A0A552X5B8_9GAMM|nr:calcium/sodium antiporter [Aliidiomarina halalkaliphila]TRW50221.1 calcium/sodium antiporter [Aliidiomarina halalkaliphila]
MLLAFVAIIFGLVLLIWSADRFVEGAAVSARHFGMSPLLIGMLVIGFGTSAPEMVVSAFAAAQGNPGLALGNAFGSNTANIGLVLGLTAVLAPITVHSNVLRREMPVLIGVTALAGLVVWNLNITRLDAIILLLVFAVVMVWTVKQGMGGDDTLGSEALSEIDSHAMPIQRAIMWLFVGLFLLIASSRVLVWGAVSVAEAMGVSDLVIGLTIVAIGTSLPELASAIVAIRKNEHDLALGNVLGSNLFNTLAVVGIAGLIHPFSFEPAVLNRDYVVMALFTLAVLVFAFRLPRWKRPGRINRIEGALFLAVYVGYLAWVVLAR